MINAVYGVKDFQIHLPQIARDMLETGGHYLVTNRNKPALVAIPFEDYQAIEDILLEFNSPTLQTSIEAGRQEYFQGKTQSLDQFLAQDE
jgi:PHD/YefM family antitoxin component YafN of YafNO toxin-antitoxin module